MIFKIAIIFSIICSIFLRNHSFIFSKYPEFRRIIRLNNKLWINEDIGLNRLEKLWRSTDFSVTIGDKGVALSHINLISQLLDHHGVLKIKLASDKLSSLEIANQIYDDSRIKEKSILLEIRSRGIMFGKKLSDETNSPSNH